MFQSLHVLFVLVFLHSCLHYDHLAWGRGSLFVCFSCVCLFVLYVLFFVIFSSSWCRGLAAVCDCVTPVPFQCQVMLPPRDISSRSLSMSRYRENPIRTRLNCPNNIHRHTLKWCVNLWYFSQRYLSDTVFLNSPLTNVTRFKKSSHINTTSGQKFRYNSVQ